MKYIKNVSISGGWVKAAELKNGSQVEINNIASKVSEVIRKEFARQI